MNENTNYDCIIVGAGAAGCVLANRLTESGRYSVLLLHAGGPDRNPWMRVPMGYGKLVNNPKYDCMYKCDAEAELNNRVLQQSQGKALGGGSSINGLVYIRGDPADYDEWQRLGNAGWSYSDVLPIFRRIESFHGGDAAYRGRDGPISVSEQPDRYSLNEAFIEAALQTGAQLNPDFNGATLEGVGYYQINTKNGRRCSTATAYLKPASRRSNLRVLTHAPANRILFEAKSAVGIEYEHEGKVHVARAHREIILAAGTYNSPQILQLSGVGPPGVLQKIGIAIVHPLSGVGENLQNHYNLPISFRSHGKGSLNQDIRSWRGRLWVALRYLLFARGPLATSPTHVGYHFRGTENTRSPDVKITLSLFSRRGNDRAPLQLDMHDFPGFSVLIHQLKPDSRGRVSIKSRDPRVAPRIQLNFSITPSFRQTITTGVRRLRQMIATPALSSMVAGELSPSRECVTDEQLMDLFRVIGMPSYHQSGTCKMGADSAAVVDAQLRVHGIKNVRVIDASIMPTLVSANTHATTIMIAEKGADMVLEAASI